MKTADSQVIEAYVIEDDGTKTAVPAGFADKKPHAQYSAAPGGKRAYAYAANAAGFAPQSPFSGATATAAPRRGLHLGRRALGVMLVLVGLPLLILPGPGLALVGLGLLMTVMP
ncbi:MAG: hypothetical protein Q4D92_07510 [Slackia sp.]|nr:hypothetical protein [Slackia sp.]